MFPFVYNDTMNELPVGLGGGSVLQIANRTGTQMMSYLIETPEGKIVMIDGGFAATENGNYLLELLKQRGGTVDLWLLTHAHHDHFGGLHWLLENHPNEIAIRDLRFSFPPREWVHNTEPEYNQYAIPFFDLLEGSGLPITPLHTGDMIDCGGMTFEILRDGEDYLRYHTINDTSSVILAHFPKRPVLFLGDLGKEAGVDLLKTPAAEKLRCDIVQLAHHGQNGVNRDFYEVVQPKICLYTTPSWLWDNDIGDGFNTGPFRTVETRRWMEELGVQHSCPCCHGDFLLK